MDKKGKLIVIEGVDGSGKETQSRALYERLKKEGEKVLFVSYPRYDNISSAMIKQYLAGGFGKDPESVNPYAASTFYAVDRYASYKEDLQDFLAGDGIVIADRYTTSNMIHQAVKLHDFEERRLFLDWLSDFEFRLLGLPEPNQVFFLDVPPEAGKNLMIHRRNKITGEKAKDIHESNPAYLRHAYHTAKELAERYQWQIVQCTNDGVMRSIESIHEEIYSSVIKLIKKG